MSVNKTTTFFVLILLNNNFLMKPVLDDDLCSFNINFLILSINFHFLQCLIQDQNIVILKEDEGSSMVILDKSYYTITRRYDRRRNQ